MSYTTKYYINEEKRTIVCVLESSPFDALDFVEKSGLRFVFKDERHLRVMPTRFVGVAKCAPEDTYNEHIGRLIAFDRAKEKYDLSFIRAADSMLDYKLGALHDCERRLDKYIAKASQHHYKREDEVDDYMNR